MSDACRQEAQERAAADYACRFSERSGFSALFEEQDTVEIKPGKAFLNQLCFATANWRDSIDDDTLNGDLSLTTLKGIFSIILKRRLFTMTATSPI